MKEVKKLFLIIVLLLALLFGCSKSGLFFEDADPFPISGVPGEIYTRANEYKNLKGYQLTFLEAIKAGMYTLMYTVDRKNESMPHDSMGLTLMRGPIGKINTEAIAYVFRGEEKEQYKCYSTAIKVEYLENYRVYIFRK